MHKQLDEMPHVMLGGLTHEPALQLASRLAHILPGAGTPERPPAYLLCGLRLGCGRESRSRWPCSTGTIRAAPTRTRFVAFQHAYHGDTTGAMSVCDPEEGMHALFKGAIPEQIIVELPETVDQLAAFEQLLMGGQREIAGVIIEPLVQGAGGMKFHSPETLAAIADCCKRHDILFIADEIATGFGRTGTMFACEQAEIVPDIMCIGKALTGGAIGMAATAANEKVFSAFLSDDEKDRLYARAHLYGEPVSGSSSQRLTWSV